MTVKGGCASILHVALLASAAFISPVAAQTVDTAAADADSGGQIADIVVTAQKREQRLSDVGISVSALSDKTMTRLGMTDSTSIIGAIPNMENSPTYGPGTNPNFSIRGVSQNDFNDGTESPVAAYVDEVYLVPTGASSFSLYDMQRVEVLRGPQGTLFGRNSTAGLIHFITAKPTDEFEGSIAGELGSYRTREVTGVLNMPLGETLAVRLSGQYHYNTGWLDNRTGNRPDGGQSKTASIRAQLRYKPNDVITNNLKVSHDDARGVTYGNFHQATGQDAVTGDQFLIAPDQNFYGTGAGRDVFGYANEDKTDFGSVHRLRSANSTLVTNKLDIDLDRVVVTSVTGFNRYERNQNEDCDGLQAKICQTHYNPVSRQFSQELRAFANLGTTRLTGGVYYLRHKIVQDTIAPLYLNTPTPIAILVQGEQVSKSFAVFGNAEFDLSPKLTFIVGARGSRDKKHFEQVLSYGLPCDEANPFPGYEGLSGTEVPVCGTLASNVFTDETAGSLTRISKDTWSAKAELDYRPTQGVLIYGSISRGVKSPGFNNGVVAIGLPPSGYQFKSETLIAYETGVKSSLFDRRATFDLSGFYYDYNNFDTLSFEGIGSLITNTDARLYGMEAELTVKPVPELTLRVNGGYTHSKLFDVANAGQVVADRQMPLAPKWTTSALIRYDLPVMQGKYNLGLQASGRARGSFYSTPGNDSAGVNPSFGIVDARVDLTEISDRYSVALSVRNLFDKKYISAIFLGTGIAGYRFGQYGQPRWVSLEFNYRFGR